MTLLLAAVPPGDADPAAGKGPEWGKAAPIGLLIILLMGLALFLLIKSMNRNLRKVPTSFDGDAQVGDQPPAASGAGSPGGDGDPGQPGAGRPQTAEDGDGDPGWPPGGDPEADAGQATGGTIRRDGRR
jgi:hypothetical protein